MNWEKLNELREVDKENKVLSQRFNGDLVMSWLPDLKGKELGHAMGKFKESFDNEDDYRKFVLTACYSAVENRFMNTYNDEPQ
jgi:hypothetical protein